MDSSTTLPVSFFQGKSLKEGTRCEIEIVGVEGDQVEVKYVPHEQRGNPSHEEFGKMVDEEAAPEATPSY